MYWSCRRRAAYNARTSIVFDGFLGGNLLSHFFICVIPDVIVTLYKVIVVVV
jgi:hypothetical protein